VAHPSGGEGKDVGLACAASSGAEGADSDEEIPRVTKASATGSSTIPPAVVYRCVPRYRSASHSRISWRPPPGGASKPGQPCQQGDNCNRARASASFPLQARGTRFLNAHGRRRPPISETVGAFILRRLHEHGIGHLFGYPGDGINGIIGGFHEHGDDIEFIQTRHEEIAAFAATAHAKLTDEVGVCLATSGPGAIHLLNGLYDAKLDHQPAVAIVGQQKTFSLGSNYQQEVDLPVTRSAETRATPTCGPSANSSTSGRTTGRLARTTPVWRGPICMLRQTAAGPFSRNSMKPT
jgi:hypothetical protein